MKSLLEILEGHFGKEGFKTFLDEKVLPVMPFSGKKLTDRRSHLRGHFAKSMPSQPSQTTHFNQDVVLLHYLCDVPLSVFDLEEDSPLRVRIEDNPLRKVKMYQLDTMESNRESVRKKSSARYYKASARYLDKLTGKFSSCLVYDYLGRYPRVKLMTKKEYLKKHETILEKLEVQLSSLKNGEVNKPAFHYGRILALPRGKCKPGVGTDFDELGITIEAIDYSHISLFKHICRCLTLYPVYEKSSELNTTTMELNHFGGFYMVGLPTRQYHYSVINKGEFCYTEYYRISKYDEYKPDLLFVEENSSFSEIAEIYLTEFEYLISKTSAKKMRMSTIRKAIAELSSQIDLNRSPKLQRELREKIDFFNSNY